MKRSDGLRSPMGWAAVWLVWVFSGTVDAAETQINNEPMGATLAAKPNLMFVMDASGSMGQDWTPDSVTDTPGAGEFRYCRDASDRFNTALDACKPRGILDVAGQPPFHASAFNLQHYNPAITYTPGVDQNGESLEVQNSDNTTGWRRVQADPYGSPALRHNLLERYPDQVWCTTSFLIDINDHSLCRANDRRDARRPGGDFRDLRNVGDYAYPSNSYHSHSLVTKPSKFEFQYPHIRDGAPYYYIIRPIVTSPTIDAPGLGGRSVVWCDKEIVRDGTLEAQVLEGYGTNIGGGTCQGQRTDTHKFVRFGAIERVDLIKDGRRFNVGTPYERSYDAEMTNFANWYAYSRTRILTMKTATGKVFSTIGPEFRVGFITICPYSKNAKGDTELCEFPTGAVPVDPARFLRIDPFQPGHKSNWFRKLYGTTPQGSTPLPEALSRVGRYFAGIATGISAGMIKADLTDDPIQFSCQQNFALLTTDGFATALDTRDLKGNPVGDLDGALPPPFFDKSAVANTLADVAQYYYQTDLRPAGSKRFDGTDLARDNVRTTPQDPNPKQHMTTFTLGLGVDGQLAYRPDYLEAAAASPPAGDYAGIVDGTINWPTAVPRTNSMVDDLWHAAVNGHGRYFSARDPESLAESLAQALAAIVAQTGAASAATVSSLEPAPGDNFAYAATFRNREWDGNLLAFEIILEGPDAGSIGTTPIWDAGLKLNARIKPPSGDPDLNVEDPRRDIFTLAVGRAGNRKPFTWASLTAEEKAFFRMDTIGPRTLTQIADWIPAGPAPDATRLANATDGENLLNYLRGHDVFEIRPKRPDQRRVFRGRQNVLGDIVNSQPQFVRRPPFDYEDLNYGRNTSPEGAASFKSLQQDRAGVVYVGSNDGMLHAFDADNGGELWAYVPRTIMPELFRLADRGYDDAHRFYVDGTAAVGDVCFKVGDACSAEEWRTILVGGFNSGGRGYYGLDVTNPAAPQVLWEFSNTDIMGKGSDFFDPDIGLSFGNPLITKIDDPAGSGAQRWVVMFSSGLNNVATGETGTGDGQGYLYIIDPQTGEMLRKIGTGAGTVETPSGLNKLAGFVCVPGVAAAAAQICSDGDTRTNNYTDRVYGADMLGNLWRFDVNNKYPEGNPFAENIPADATRDAHLLAVLKDAAGNRQPVTIRPELGEVLTRAGTRALLMVGTGRFLGEDDRLDHSQQSIYAIKDDLDDVTLDPARATLVQQTITLLSEEVRTTTSHTVDLTTNDGWFIDLPEKGERVNINMVFQLGTLVVGSNIPNDDACSVGGDSWVNFFDFRTGAPVSRAAGGRTGQKIKGRLLVGLSLFRPVGQEAKGYAFDITGTGIEFEPPIEALPPQGRRVSWREIIE